MRGNEKNHICKAEDLNLVKVFGSSGQMFVELECRECGMKWMLPKIDNSLQCL